MGAATPLVFFFPPGGRNLAQAVMGQFFFSVTQVENQKHSRRQKKLTRMPAKKATGTKRAPSAYNIFVKQYIATHPGAGISGAAAAWGKKKQGPQLYSAKPEANPGNWSDDEYREYIGLGKRLANLSPAEKQRFSTLFVKIKKGG